eukprot:jgi/Bigna1/73438/fgenesh1_pg.24_\
MKTLLMHPNTSGTCILLGSLSRAIFYIAVPFYARKLLPAAVVGVLYGVSYPMVNGAVSGVVLAMAEQLRDLHVFQKKVYLLNSKREKLAEQLSGLLPTLRAFIAVAGILNILLQATTDTLRTLGNGGKGLLVSRIYYLVYGAFLLLGLFSLLVEASRDYSMKKMKGTLDEMRRISLSIAVLYTLLLTYESVFLAAYEYIFKDGDDDWYFAALLIQQVLYCLLFLTLSIIVYRAAIRHRKKRQDVKRDDINVVENKAPFSRRLRSILYGSERKRQQKAATTNRLYTSTHSMQVIKETTELPSMKGIDGGDRAEWGRSSSRNLSAQRISRRERGSLPAAMLEDLKNMETKLELPDEKGLKRASIAESEVPRQTSISIQNINNTLEHFGPYYGQGPDGVNTLNHRPARQKRHGSILNRDTDVLFSPARKKHLAVGSVAYMENRQRKQGRKQRC